MSKCVTPVTKIMGEPMYSYAVAALLLLSVLTAIMGAGGAALLSSFLAVLVGLSGVAFQTDTGESRHTLLALKTPKQKQTVLASSTSGAPRPIWRANPTPPPATPAPAPAPAPASLERDVAASPPPEPEQQVEEATGIVPVGDEDAAYLMGAQFTDELDALDAVQDLLYSEVSAFENDIHFVPVDEDTDKKHQ